VLRASGTEPVIRVMVEGRDEATTRAAAAELAEVVANAAA
jgi:phosphomannomutase